MSQTNKFQAPVNEISDDHILSLLRTESSYEEGFRKLMLKYQERMYWQVRRMVLNHDDANDVVQNAFIKVYRSIHNFEGKSKLYTWLYRIAINESISFLNKKKRTATDSIDNDANDAQILTNQLRADSYFDGDEAQLRLHKALNTLPDKQRIVFNLRYFEEMSYNHISEVLGTSVGALKASYHHAVKKIEFYLREVESG